MAPKVKKAIKKIRSSRGSSIEPIASLNPVEEEHLVPSNVPIQCHRRTSIGPNQEKYEIREADFRRLKDKYFIPDSIRLTVPSPNEWILSLSFRCVAFYEDAFDAGVWFPLHPFIRNVLDFYNQLNFLPTVSR